MEIKEYFSNPDLTLFDAVAGFFTNEIGVRIGFVSKKPSSINKVIPNSNLHKLVRQIYFIGAVNENSLGRQQRDLFIDAKLNDNKYEGLLIFSCELNVANPTRTELADLTRNLNRASNLLPVVVFFKYANKLCLATSERTDFKVKSKEGEKAGRVHLLKDILIDSPHPGHVRILTDLQKNVMQAVSFDDLYNKWYETFDVSILNKKFFQELANWYFWAMNNVQFPDDIEKKKDIRNATNLIRLITRVIFIWFIKEKKLVPEYLFKKEYLEKILIDFNKNRKTENYYPAILQNLFFGTLNQRMNERKFADSHKGFYKKDQAIRNIYRFADKFKISEREIVKLFAGVPFLNGGLFDCLDKTDEENKKEIFVDGFTRDVKHQAHIPDYLFFASEQSVDHNEIFGTKNKNYKVKGLFNLLESYKFTVSENTPIEEEIALDPELLGKVFENLLASYNPETQTTARKQTGSFYTPREIVNYMVDESLIEYLLNKCSEIDDLETRIRELFSYSEYSKQFKEQEAKILIEAINNCKILDPACGSGAFPMGVLHKMVHILQKLDPDNRYWKEQQKQKLIGDQIKQLENDRQAIKGLTDKAVRQKAEKAVEERLMEVDEIFNRENNFDDYARKLYLIENCIYGVDIQPIAVQIAKLRFFISLVIDQKKQDNKENFGIRSLPNLETKFVAANTLIGLDKPVRFDFRNQNIVALELKLKENRHKNFAAKTKTEKVYNQIEDKDLRKKIALEIKSEYFIHEKSIRKQIDDLKFQLELSKKAKIKEEQKDKYIRAKAEIENKILKFENSLIDKSIIDDTADRISAFDIYDVNHFANWFDSEWMFGILDGFDVVIGNPPYVSAVSMARTEKEKLYYKMKYPEATGAYDLYVLFLLRTLELVAINGVYTWIIPNKFLIADYAADTKTKLLKQGLIYSIDVSTFNVFENANVYPIIIFGSKNRQKEFQEYLLEVYTDLELKKFKRPIKLREHKTFSDYEIKFASGATGFEAENLKQFLTATPTKSTIPFVVSGCIDRYFVSNTNVRFMGMKLGTAYIKQSSQIAYSKWKFWEGAKIVIAGMTKVIESTFEEGPLGLGVGVYAIYDWNDFNPKYLVAILNSKYLTYYINIKFKDKHLAGGYLAINKSTLEQLPLVKPSTSVERDIVKLVDKIILAKTKNADTQNYEDQIDKLVYKLFELTDEEITLIEATHE